MDDTWELLDCFCKNCGHPLYGRPARGESVRVIAGCEPMEYIHADGSYKCRCTIRRAEPYSDWGMYNTYKRILARNTDDAPEEKE